MSLNSFNKYVLGEKLNDYLNTQIENSHYYYVENDSIFDEYRTSEDS